MIGPDSSSTAGPEPRIIQNVYAFGGFAYGAINADVHVHGDGRPVYLLEDHKPATGNPGPAWSAQPSRLLDARSAVVPFTGREADLHELESWRGDGSDTGMRVRWLYGPGGRGKSRLADQFAATSAGCGWKTVTARHGGTVSGESQGSLDALPGDRIGLLVVADYADRWPLRDLTWLFANSLFRNSLSQGVPVRVLLLARTDDPWPAVQSMIGDRAAASAMELEEVPDTAGVREQLFAVARARFAELYQLPDANDAALPIPRDHPDSGLILTLHMAALTAVDALAHGRRPPKDTAGLSAYLLNREREHWQRLCENGAGGAGSTPDAMAGAAFVAALTGAVDWERGTRALALARLADSPAAVRPLLSDHARCYPPLDPATVLEPLYPDRLAEDFIALTLPGHGVAGYRADPWAAAVPAALLTGDEAPAYAARALTFLAAAAERWPHVRTTVFHPLLTSEPRLALATEPRPQVGHAEAVLPDQRTMDYLLGELDTLDNHQPLERVRPERARDYAVYAVHLHRRRLAAAPDAAARAKLHGSLGTRLAKIGRYQEAVAFSAEAVALYRLNPGNSDVWAACVLAAALTNLARDLAGAGDVGRAVEASDEAVGLVRTDAGRPLTDALVAHTLAAHSGLLWKLGRRDEAVQVAEEAVGLYRSHINSEWLDLVRPGDEVSRIEFASALSDLGVMLRESGGHRQALELAEEAVNTLRQLPVFTLAPRRDEYAHTLVNLSDQLRHAQRTAEAGEAAREAIEIYRRLAATSPDAHEPRLAGALVSLANCLDDPREALAAVRPAIEILQRLATARAKQSTPDLQAAQELARLLTERAEQDGSGFPLALPAPEPRPRDAAAILLAGKEHRDTSRMRDEGYRLVEVWNLGVGGDRPASRFGERVGHLVDLWDSSGRSDEWLATGTSGHRRLAFFTLICWDHDRRSDHPDQRPDQRWSSAAVRAYVAACRAANGGDRGWDDMLWQRLECPGCGDTWRLENVQACTECSRYTCYQCASIDHRGEFCEVVG